MRSRILGSTGVQVPIIGQGTWMMEQSPEKSILSLRKGIELGLTHIDTAEMYGSGKVETLVGKALERLRKKVFLVSKVLPSHASFEKTIAACERSLKRLKTDYLDLYLLHWPESTPFEETCRAFEKLKKDGKILAYGVSNFNEKDMEKAVQVAGESTLACNQIFYHLKERTIENTPLPWCLKRNIAVVGYSPYGQGQFTSLKTPGGKILETIAARHRATPHQVALAFLTRFEGTFVIPKSSNIEHVIENAGALDLTLTEADIQEIDRFFPRGNKRNLPMV